MSNKVIYTKFSNDRAGKYRIATDILQDGERRFVRKRAVGDASVNHVMRLLTIEEKLTRYFQGTRFSCNKSVAHGASYVDYEFVSGMSYEEFLDQFLHEKDYDGLYSAMADFFHELEKLPLQPFEADDTFRTFFGEILPEPGELSIAVANTDLIFQNVLIDAEGMWNVIDYEWTFDCLLPVKYLIYRALWNYTVNMTTRQALKFDEMLSRFGINSRQKRCYALMEAHFQSAIKGGRCMLGDYYAMFGQPSLLTSELAKREESNLITVYFDFGNGFLEEHKVVFSTFPIRVELPEGIKALRVDPCAQSSLIQVKKIVSDKNRTLHYTTNGLKLSDEIYYFETDDPNVVIADISGREQSVSIDIDNTMENPEMIRLMESYPAMESEIVSLRSQIHALRSQIYALQMAVDEFNNSFSWRLTKPLRFFLTKLRGFSQRHHSVQKIYKGARYFGRNGLKKTVRKLKEKADIAAEIKRHANAFLPPESELSIQQKTQFAVSPCISILVPLYNTPENFLKEMIESVLGQTYGNWELCLADGSDSGHTGVGQICRSYAEKEKRIRYKKLEKNEGISENTNACLAMATGAYIALFDHDDLLHPGALFACVKAINEQGADFIYTDEMTFLNTTDHVINVHYKPDYSPDTLRSYNYICHLSVFSKELSDKVGNFNKKYDGSQDYDMILRLTEQAKRIVHIPKVLYFWRAHEHSVAQDISAKPYTLEAARGALADHLKRVGLKGDVLDSRIPTVYKINYQIEGAPLISILIPNKDHVAELRLCVDSIMKKSTYRNFEIIVIENNSTETETIAYYQELERTYRNLKVIYWDREFNYSAINNFGVKEASGEYLLLLNNDIEVITESWLEEMLMFCQREDVGAVGAMLYYPDDTIQHAGVIVGIGGVAGHSHKYFKRGDPGYSSRLTLAQNLSAVTAACVMIKKCVYDEVGGLDEGFQVAFNDIDLCMRIREKGYLIVFTPFAELYHYESKSRGLEDTVEKQQRFQGEINRFHAKWGRELAEGDPYYNPNLTLEREDFSFK